MNTSDGQKRIKEALGKIYEDQPPYFREYMRRFRENPTSRVFAPLAEAYRRMGRIEEAIAICREGLEHHPDFHGGRVALAKCFIDKRMFSEARTELQRVVNGSPENLLAQRLLGDVSLDLGDRAGALHCYKMALLLSPADVALAEKVHQLETEDPQALTPAPLLHEEPVLAAGARSESSYADLAPLWETSAKEPTPSAASLWGPDVASDPASIEEESGVSETALFDGGDIDDEGFKIEHVSAVFSESDNKAEITTGTLGDLYFSQGQFDRALRIYEKLKQTPEVRRKVETCRARLGVDTGSRVRQRQIDVVRGMLHALKSEPGSKA